MYALAHVYYYFRIVLHPTVAVGVEPSSLSFGHTTGSIIGSMSAVLQLVELHYRALRVSRQD